MTAAMEFWPDIQLNLNHILVRLNLWLLRQGRSALVKRKRDIMNFGLLIVIFALKAAGYKVRMTDVRWTTRATEKEK